MLVHLPVTALSPFSMVPGPHHVCAMTSLPPSLLQDPEAFQGLCSLLGQIIVCYLKIQSTILLNVQEGHPKKILVLLSNISLDRFWKAALLFSAQQALRDLAQLSFSCTKALLLHHRK